MAAEMLPASPLSEHTSHIDRAQTKLLNRLRGAGMTKEGQEWLIAAVDPYHDLALSLAGYPDGARERSIVQVVKRDITIAKPPSLVLAPGESWDAHVFTMPNLQGENGLGLIGGSPAYAKFTRVVGDNLQNTPADANLPIGGFPLPSLGNVNIVYTVSDTPTWCRGSSYPGTGASGVPPGSGDFFCESISPDYEVGQTPGGQVEMSSDYCAGLHRVIAQGMELTNVTKVLDTEGYVTVYSQASRVNEGVGNTYTSGTSPGPSGPSGKIVRMSGPPASKDEALNLPGARQWNSKYGAYVVNRLINDELPYTTFKQCKAVWDGGNYEPLTPNPSETTGTAAVSFFRQSGSGVGANQAGMNRSFDFTKAQHGVYISGQGPDAKFQLTVRWVIERSARQATPGLVVLQPPSPAYDPLARMVYSECMRMAPPGVRLDENAFGTWFRDAAGRVLNHVLPVATAGLKAGLPVAATVATKNPLAGQLVAELIESASGPSKQARRRERQKEARKALKQRETVEEIVRVSQPRRRKR